MSWMTSSAAGAGAAAGGPGTADGTADGTGSAPDMAALLFRSEDLGEVVAAALHPDQSDTEVGRPARAKVMPWALIGILLVPPLIIALSILLTGGDQLPISYTQYPSSMSLVIALFVAGAAPYCVSRDLRHGVMPLYLSRPMKRSDYVFAKFAGLSISLLSLIHISEPTRLGMISYAVFCLKKKKI